MIVTQSIREAPTTRDDVFAFHILGEVSSEDMQAMAERMNEAFDAHESVSMLLIFDTYDGSETGAGWDWESIKSRIRSVNKVEKYAVVNAPDSAATLIENMGKILPLEARSFDSEDAAWAWIGGGAQDQTTALHR